jgi:aconitate hydratase
VLAKGFARIHRQNLINYGILPLILIHSEDYELLQEAETLRLRGLLHALKSEKEVAVECCAGTIVSRHELTDKQLDVIRAGGLINWRRHRQREGQI